MDAKQKVKLAEIRQAVQELRRIHHLLRHPHIDGCVECIHLKWRKEQGF